MESRREFLERRPYPFEPGNVFDSRLLEYQETLGPEYRERRLSLREE